MMGRGLGPFSRGYIRAMGKAQQFAARVNYEGFDACVLDLTQRNAFREPDEARLVWQT